MLMDCINNIPDDKLIDMLEKYTPNKGRYYFGVENDTEQSKQNVEIIINELKRRTEFRESIKPKKLKTNTIDIYYELINHM